MTKTKTPKTPKAVERQLSSLKENPNNPRKITDKRIKELTNALKEFGDLGCVVFNRKTKQIVGGHQRSKVFAGGKACITNELAKPNKTGTIAEGFITYNGENYKYREVFWTKEKEIAANIAANSNAGEWDLPILSDLVRQLDFSGMDLSLTMLDKNLVEDLIVPTLHPKDAGESKGRVIKETEMTIKSKKTLENHCPKCGHDY